MFSLQIKKISLSQVKKVPRSRTGRPLNYAWVGSGRGPSLGKTEKNRNMVETKEKSTKMERNVGKK